MKNDLISRQDALNFKATITGVRSGKTVILKLFEAYQDYIKSLPSAQPEKRTEERTETHSCDYISRQAAIDTLMEEFKRIPTTAIRAKNIIEGLPSAQPEQPEREISYRDCCYAMLKMWIVDVLTDGEYYKIMDKLNEHEKARRER